MNKIVVKLLKVIYQTFSDTMCSNAKYQISPHHTIFIIILMSVKMAEFMDFKVWLTKIL